LNVLYERDSMMPGFIVCSEEMVILKMKSIVSCKMNESESNPT
jgi:hypothetical protein